MQRNDDGSVTFDRSEVRLLRAALSTIAHHADTARDADEIRAVSGHRVDEYSAALLSIDSLANPEDQLADSLDRVRGNLALLEAEDDSAFTEVFRLQGLRDTVNEALTLGIPVSDRLVHLAQED